MLVTPEAESIIDSYGIELIHPIQLGRSPARAGKKGKSNHNWLVGIKACWLITPQGQVIEGLGNGQGIRPEILRFRNDLAD